MTRSEPSGREKESLVQLYRRRARRYDFTANLYYLIGFRLQAYRKMAVQALTLEPGDTVVEIGCGTGANFPLLDRAVGPGGKIIGVDLTDAMIAQARKRVGENKWLSPARGLPLEEAVCSVWLRGSGGNDARERASLP